MMKQYNLSVIALATVMAVSSVGCSSGFRSGNSASTNGAQSLTPAATGEDQLAKAQAAVVESQKAMESATAALATLNNANGTIDLSLFENTGSVIAPVMAKLKAAFDQAFAKFAEVRAKFDAAKAAVAVEIAKLDPNDPTAKLLTEQLTKITELEAKFTDQVHALAAKLTDVNLKIDQLVMQATAYIPIPWLSVIAGFLIDTLIMKDVKALILDLQTRLLAL